jgi:Ca2+-binding EF-hand superfamily protein
MDSKLPVDTLGKIWDLADVDKDGMLDRHEFMVVRATVELFQPFRSLLRHFKNYFVETLSLHLFVTWYQQLNCLSDFYEMWCRGLYKKPYQHGFCENRLCDSLHFGA